MKTFAKILTFCLICVLACFSFAGCTGGSFIPAGITSPDAIKQMADEAVAEQKKAMVDVFKNNFNGVKVVYMPDQATEAEADKALEVLLDASETALNYVKVTNPELLLAFADFYWTDGVNNYKLSKVENYHYTATRVPADALKIKEAGDNYYWFDGEQWRPLTSTEENYHYTLTVGEDTKYFYINSEDETNKYFYNETESYVYEENVSVSLEMFDEMVYFYINNLNLLHQYYYNLTETYEYTEGVSQELNLVVEGTGEEEPTSADLVLDLNGFVDTYKNKLAASFINSICNLTGSHVIPTDEETDGQAEAYVNIMKARITSFSYFGLKDKDADAGVTFLISLPVGLSSETVTQALVLAKANVFLALGKNWQYNIYIENFTIDQLSSYIEDDKKFLGERKYLSIIYMNKDTYAPYEKNATTTLYPDECTLLFETRWNTNELGDITATFSFLAKNAEEGYSHGFDVVHDGDIMVDEDGIPFEDENGNPIAYEGDNALNLEIFTKTEDVTNVLTLNTGFTKENDETKNGSGWSGIVRTFNGIGFNFQLISSLEQTQTGDVERIYYTSQFHDVMQIVFDKTESFNIAGVGSLALYDETQIDWNALNDFLNND